MGIEIQWPLVLFTLVAGVGGGLLIPAGLAQLAGKANAKAQFIAAVVSMVLLVAGGCCSLLHLAAPQNVMAAVLNVFSFSGISLELILLGLCFVVAAVFAVLLKREVAPSALKAVAVLGIVFALLLLFFCGHGYVMPSRPAWDTNMLPLAYLGTSVAGGAFAYGLILAACKAEGEELAFFKPVALAASIVCAVTCAAYGIVSISAAAASPIAFWGGVIGVGVIVMLAVGVFAYGKLDGSNAMTLAAIGLVVAVVAMLAVRIAMWDTSAGYLELFDLAAAAAMVIR